MHGGCTTPDHDADMHLKGCLDAACSEQALSMKRVALGAGIDEHKCFMSTLSQPDYCFCCEL